MSDDFDAAAAAAHLRETVAALAAGTDRPNTAVERLREAAPGLAAEVRRVADAAVQQMVAAGVRYWLASGYDVAEMLAHTLCTVAAGEADGIDAITRNRPGSWEADHINGLIRGTAGEYGEHLDQYREDTTDDGHNR